MIWAALAVCALAALSLAGTLHTRRDMRSGAVSYASLVDHTGIWDRARLAEVCGPPDAADRYAVSRETIRGLGRRAWVRLLDDPWLDVVTLAAAIGVVTAPRPLPPHVGWVIVGVLGGYQLLGWAVAAVVATRAGLAGDVTAGE